MDIEDALHYTQKCFHGEFASCTYACPLHLDIRSFLEKVSRNNWTAAYSILRETLIFPEIVCRLCPAPCRDHCLRKFHDFPLALPDLEMACLRYANNKAAKTYNIPGKSSHIMIVGAGVSGLACALRLAIKKYRVTVYEREDGYGGMLRGHESARLFLEDISRQFAAEKVDFCFNTEIKSLAQLSGNAVYVATGGGEDQFSLLDGWNKELLTTTRPGTFLGGGITGSDILEAIGQGARASKQIEIFLQTGKNARYENNFPAAKKERYVPVPDILVSPKIEMADPSAGYTAEEACEEAGRCLQCNCSACLNDCEMLSAFRKKPRQIATEVYMDTIVVPELSGRSLTRQVFSCNLCGHCSSQCPEQINLGSLFLFARRDRAEAKSIPPAFHNYWLSEMEQTRSLYSIARVPRGKDNCGYAFFPGCQLGASAPAYVKLSYSRLNTCLDGDVGLLLNCCGAPAYWAGETRLHEQLVAELSEQWRSMGKPVMIFACIQCQSLWQEYLPEAGALSLYEILARHGAPDSRAGTSELAMLNPSSSEHTVFDPYAEDLAVFDPCSAEFAVFDPCSAAGSSEARGSVRELARKAGVTPHELIFSGETAKCCGWGGHIQIANDKLFDTIVENRISSSDLPYIVYCANCRDVFAAKGKQCLHILDIVFGLDDGSRPAPSLKERENNRLTLKRDLLSAWWGVDFEIEPKPWDKIELIIPPPLRQKTESRLIPENHIQKAVWELEKTKNVFFDIKSQTYIGSYTSDVMTLWVQYSKDGTAGYRIWDVYYHRMSFNN